MMGTGVQPSLWNSLGEIGSPTLIIAGEHDGKFRRFAEEVHTHIPGSSYTMIEDVGHNVHWERPSEYAQLVLKFLTRI